MQEDTITVYCHAHGVSFTTPRSNRAVICKKGSPHVLSSNFPNSGRWFYCCHCRVNWIAVKEQGNARGQCPVCGFIKNPRYYSCDRCNVTMLDAWGTANQGDIYLTPWGAPYPYCSGCRQLPKGVSQSHTCSELKGLVTTARAECPFCEADEVEKEVEADAAKTEIVNGRATNPTPDLVGVETVPPDLLLEELERKAAEIRALEAEAEAREAKAQERLRQAELKLQREMALRSQVEQKSKSIEQELRQGLETSAESVRPDAVPIASGETAQIEAEWKARLLSELAKAEAETRAREAQAEARAREAEARAEQAEARARQAEERCQLEIEEVISRAQGALLFSEDAQKKADEAEARFREMEARAGEAEDRCRQIAQQSREEVEAIKRLITQQSREEVEGVKRQLAQQSREEVEGVKRQIAHQSREEVEAVRHQIAQQSREEVEAVKRQLAQQSREEVEGVKRQLAQQSREEVEGVKRQLAQQSREEVEGVRRQLAQQSREEVEAVKKDAGARIEAEAQARREAETAKIKALQAEAKAKQSNDKYKVEITKIKAEVEARIREIDEKAMQAEASYKGEISEIRAKLEATVAAASQAEERHRAEVEESIASVQATMLAIEETREKLIETEAKYQETEARARRGETRSQRVYLVSKLSFALIEQIFGGTLKMSDEKAGLAIPPDFATDAHADKFSPKAPESDTNGSVAYVDLSSPDKLRALFEALMSAQVIDDESAGAASGRSRAKDKLATNEDVIPT